MSRRKRSQTVGNDDSIRSNSTLSTNAAANPAILRIGALVAQHRARLGQVQKKLADSVISSNRTEISELEDGHKLPPPDRLEQICEALKIPRDLWAAAVHPEYLVACQFQHHLGNLLGKPLQLDRLGGPASLLAIDRIARLLKGQHSTVQAFDSFRSVLTFYGERLPTEAFFTHFLGEDAFKNIDAFAQQVKIFMAVGLRLFGNFRRSWKTLSVLDKDGLQAALLPLQAVPQAIYSNRRPFNCIDSIPPERLDDLGYISVERARKEHKDRLYLSNSLVELAKEVDTIGPNAIDDIPGVKQRRVQSLLRAFGSDIELQASLFGSITGDRLRIEAERIKPTDDDLARIENTQERGLRNLCSYLSEPFIDAYVATSMREHADYVAVNAFVEAVFGHPDLSQLHLRYFNPTQSWIADRVAKGLVEALMLRRSKLTIYMAQRGDTFGKDSEASVALGQGKAVIVYVPHLHDTASGVSSQRAHASTESDLRDRLRALAIEVDEAHEHKDLVGEVLRAELKRLPLADLARIVLNHWADFDLPGEVRLIPEVVRTSWKKYFERVSQWRSLQEPPLPDETLAEIICIRLSEVAVQFERRASLFRDTHPLALQVIVETGVVNGMMVVRSVNECATLMYRVLTNTVEMDIEEGDENFVLRERISRSTLRVVSKFGLLTNAFWTQYFEDDEH